MPSLPSTCGIIILANRLMKIVFKRETNVRFTMKKKRDKPRQNQSFHRSFSLLCPIRLFVCVYVYHLCLSRFPLNISKHLLVSFPCLHLLATALKFVDWNFILSFLNIFIVIIIIVHNLSLPFFSLLPLLLNIEFYVKRISAIFTRHTHTHTLSSQHKTNIQICTTNKI